MLAMFSEQKIFVARVALRVYRRLGFGLVTATRHDSKRPRRRAIGDLSFTLASRQKRNRATPTSRRRSGHFHSRPYATPDGGSPCAWRLISAATFGVMYHTRSMLERAFVHSSAFF